MVGVGPEAALGWSAGGGAPVPGVGLMSTPTVDVRAKAIGYGGRAILERIELTIRGPGVVAIVGRNGAGKSTLLKATVGLLRGAGIDVSICGQSLSGLPPRRIAGLAAWVPQRAETVFAMSLVEMVRVGRYRMNVPLRRAPGEESMIRSALGQVGLADLADREVDTLSGGEWQRALVARAIVQDAPVLVLDEPVASLDLEYQEQVYRLLTRLAEQGRLVIVADHHLEVAASYAGRILGLRDGRVVADGAPADVLTSERIEEIFGVRVRVFSDPVTGSPRLSRPERLP
jgi:iron complex transport system ATP-binding protein